MTELKTNNAHGAWYTNNLTTIVSPDKHPYFSGSSQRETQKEEEGDKSHTSLCDVTIDNEFQFESPTQAESPFMTEEEKEAMDEMELYAQHKDYTIPSFDFRSSDDEQETKPPPSTEQKIIKHEKLIEEMEQTIDQNTLMIKRLSNMIKTLEDKAGSYRNFNKS